MLVALAGETTARVTPAARLTAKAVLVGLIAGATSIDALNGEPGVHSKRFAGEDATDGDRVRIVLQKLEGVPWEQRTAQYRCVIAVAEPGVNTVTCESVCSGIIGHELRGSGGFGYDPVFYLPEYDQTVAELPLKEKNKISHRAKAAKQAIVLLKERTNSRFLDT